MHARTTFHTWLSDKAAALASDSPLYGLGVHRDFAAFNDPSNTAQFGVTLGNQVSKRGTDADGGLVERDGQLELIVYARVSNANKRDWQTDTERVETIIAWLDGVIGTPTGLTLCRVDLQGEWRFPARGDALEGQPYPFMIGTLEYDE